MLYNNRVALINESSKRIEGKKIILLHAFLKKTPKTPRQEITRALNNFEDYKINKNLIEYGKET